MNHYLYKKGELTLNNIEADVVTAVYAWAKSLGVDRDIIISTDAFSDYLELKATAEAVSFTITAKVKNNYLDLVQCLDDGGVYNES